MQLKDLLVNEMQKLGPGDRLPSIRELIARTGLAHLTVVKALNELEAEGYIDLFPGKGAFVSRRARCEHGASVRGSGTIVLATPEWDDHNIWSVNHHAMAQAVRAGRNLVSWRFWPGTRLEELADFARRQADLAGVIVMPPSEAILPSDAAHLDALGIPVVYLSPDPPVGEHVHAVAVDPRACGAAMARHLVAAGHRRLAFVQNQPRTRVSDEMVAGAAEAAATGLSTLEVHEAGLRAWGDPMAAAVAATPEAAAGGATGLIYTSADGAFAALAVLRSLGRRVPQDVSVIGSADQPILAYADPPVAATRSDHAAGMAEAFAMIAGNGRRRFDQPVQIANRASIGTPGQP